MLSSGVGLNQSNLPKRVVKLQSKNIFGFVFFIIQFNPLWYIFFKLWSFEFSGLLGGYVNCSIASVACSKSPIIQVHGHLVTPTRHSCSETALKLICIFDGFIKPQFLLPKKRPVGIISQLLKFNMCPCRFICLK